MSEKYTAYFHRDLWYIRVNEQCGDCPAPTHFIASFVNEAQAKVMAWALEQVHQGRTITALIPPEQASGIRYAGFYCEDYSGPKEV